jgi:hypothetical protein
VRQTKVRTPWLSPTCTTSIALPTLRLSCRCGPVFSILGDSHDIVSESPSLGTPLASQSSFAATPSYSMQRRFSRNDRDRRGHTIRGKLLGVLEIKFLIGEHTHTHASIPLPPTFSEPRSSRDHSRCPADGGPTSHPHRLPWQASHMNDLAACRRDWLSPQSMGRGLNQGRTPPCANSRRTSDGARLRDGGGCS